MTLSTFPTFLTFLTQTVCFFGPCQRPLAEPGNPVLLSPRADRRAGRRRLDGRRFLARWGEPADALGWTAKDLFGLHKPPASPHPSYSRLSRYDETGLVWLLRGREVVALTEATAAIQSSTGAITTYLRFNKPAFGPLGDSLDDLEPPSGGNAA